MAVSRRIVNIEEKRWRCYSIDGYNATDQKASVENWLLIVMTGEINQLAGGVMVSVMKLGMANSLGKLLISMPVVIFSIGYWNKINIIWPSNDIDSLSQYWPQPMTAVRRRMAQYWIHYPVVIVVMTGQWQAVINTVLLTGSMANEIF